MDTELKKMINGDIYHQTKELLSLRLDLRDKLYEYNHCRPREIEKRMRLIRDMFGQVSKNYYVEQPFYCDYGFNITIGDNFFSNSNLTLLDVAPITIGNDVLIAPNVGIYTAGHVLDPEIRKKTGAEFGQPITIGNNCWIGANVTILPGVTIGDNVVVGAGSVVTKDLPNDVLAVGNPCKVLRKFNDKDRSIYFKEKKIPQEYLDESNSRAIRPVKI